MSHRLDGRGAPRGVAPSWRAFIVPIGVTTLSAVLVGMVAITTLSSASSGGGLSVSPLSGASSTVSTFTTTGQCPSGETVLVKVFGGSGAGATIAAPANRISPKNINGAILADSLFDNSGGMTITAFQTWADFASGGNPALSTLNGGYTVRAWCSGGTWFEGPVTFSGGPLSSVTYSAGGPTPTPTPTVTPTPTPTVTPTPTPTVTPTPTPTGPASVPTNPVDVELLPGRISLRAQWGVPLSDGGSAITGYTVEVKPTSLPVAWEMCVVDGRTATCTDLDPDTDYTVRVAAVNTVGPSIPTTANTRTTVTDTRPGEPRSVTATAGNGSALVSWVAPVSDGGSSITSYTVTSSPRASGGAQVCSTSGSAGSCRARGLTNGTEYTFTVAASNAVGAGPAVMSNPTTPQTVRPAPTPTPTPSSTPGPTGSAGFAGFTVAAVDGNGRFLPTNPSLIPGAVVTLVTSGFKPGESLTYLVFSDPVVIGAGNADSFGSIVARLGVPENLNVGRHRFVIEGSSGRSVTVPFAVVAAGGSSAAPTADPTSEPSADPSADPSAAPTAAPTVGPDAIVFPSGGVTLTPKPEASPSLSESAAAVAIERLEVVTADTGAPTWLFGAVAAVILALLVAAVAYVFGRRSAARPSRSTTETSAPADEDLISVSSIDEQGVNTVEHGS